MFLVKILRQIFSIIKAIDRADIPVLKILPSKTKQRLIRMFYKPLTAHLPKAIELNGLLFHVPRQLDYSYILYEHEPETQQIMKRYIRPEMVAVDVGANIGYLTLFMARLVGPKGKVYAVEPGQDNLELLRKNIQINGFTNVEVLPYAAGVEHRYKNFYLRKAGTLHSAYAQADTIIETLQVLEVSLDQVIKERVDFVKIDAEGGDLEVLKGMTHILRSNPELQLVVEWCPSALQRAGHSAEELPEFLMEKGFTLSVIDGWAEPLQSMDDIIRCVQTNRLDNSWHANLYAQRTAR